MPGRSAISFSVPVARRSHGSAGGARVSRASRSRLDRRHAIPGRSADRAAARARAGRARAWRARADRGGRARVPRARGALGQPSRMAHRDRRRRPRGDAQVRGGGAGPRAPGPQPAGHGRLGGHRVDPARQHASRSSWSRPWARRPTSSGASSRGADDYLTKPVRMSELVARIAAALRRVRLAGGRPADEPIEHPGLRIEPATHRVVGEASEVHLTPTEFRLLVTLARHPGIAAEPRGAAARRLGTHLRRGDAAPARHHAQPAGEAGRRVPRPDVHRHRVRAGLPLPAGAERAGARIPSARIARVPSSHRPPVSLPRPRALGAPS